MSIGSTELTPTGLRLSSPTGARKTHDPDVCDPFTIKIGMRVKSVFRKIATDGECGIIHYGTKFVPVE